VPLTTIALLALAGFAAGLVDSIGGGGGLVTVPALLATGMPPAVALATNKGQASFGAISSFGSFWARGGIDRARAPLGFACGFLGSLAGARVLLLIRPEPLRPVVIVLLLLAAGFLAWPRKPREGKRSPVREGRDDAPPSSSPGRIARSARDSAHARAMLALAPLSLALGFYDGFFGPGTGSMLIVGFVLLFGDTLTRASGNAKVVNLASNLAALAIFVWRGTILWEIAIPMAVANATGAFVGARLAVKRGDKLVRVVVLAVVGAVVIKMLYDLAR
jgi:hypothetical protein